MPLREHKTAAAEEPPPAPYCFVTVGTTSFDALVAACVTPEFGAAAWAAGARAVRLQLGRGAAPAALGAPRRGGGGGGGGGGDAEEWACSLPLPGGRALPYAAFRVRASVAADVAGAAFVVSHAGAGSVFEALRAGARLVVATNDALADNHQAELAGALAARGLLAAGAPADVPALVARLAAAPPPPRLPPLDRSRFLEGVRHALGGAAAADRDE